MSTSTSPSAHFGWEGQTLEYTVTAPGAAELIVSDQAEKGLDVRILESRPMGDGVEARVAVRITEPTFY